VAACGERIEGLPPTIHRSAKCLGDRYPPGRAIADEESDGANSDEHIQWPQGQGKPAVVLFKAEETKNKIPLEFDLPPVLSDRLHVYRNKIAPAVTGRRPDHLFLTWRGKPRTQAAIAVAIEKTVLKYVGVRLTPHQFRHLAAKMRLDENPGAYGLVRDLMGHKNMETTTNFYAGIDTKRAGRAQIELIAKIKKADID